VTLPDPELLKAKYKLSYHVDCLERLRSAGAIRGARVLEVGGALPGSLVIDTYGAASWTSVDLVAEYSKMIGLRKSLEQRLAGTSLPARVGEWISYDGRASALPATFSGSFDVCVSIATFEHVLDLDATFAAIGRALAPSGRLFAQVGPIWSSWRGHHVFPDYFSPHQDLTKDMLDRMVPWQHLVMDDAGFEAWARKLYGQEFASIACTSVYRSQRLNRLMFADYLSAFKRAGFAVRGEIQPNGSAVPSEWSTGWQDTVRRGRCIASRLDVDCFWAELCLD
jgi:SAM-dependent methyltransferase